MGVEENGLTLEGLAQRLQALERENTELRSKVATLEGSDTRRDGLAELKDSDTRLDGAPASVLEGPMSRRSLLSKAGAAAVAAMAAGTLLYPRQARAHELGEPFIGDWVMTHDMTARQDVADRRAIDAINNSHSVGFATIEALNQGSGAAVNGESEGSGPAVVGKGGSTGVRGVGGSLAGTGVEGTATGSLGYGVRGTGFSGVWGESSHADGRGVMGLNTNGTGVKGEGKIGVLGVGSDAQQAGVKGEGHTGVWGITSTRDFAGVYGEHKGTKGIGTVGIGKGDDTGVLGRNPTGQGLRGEGRYGVVAIGGSTGYGGRFEGGKAQLMLKPRASAGKPTTGAHAKGEISMDSAATLWVCTVAGTPGTWRKVATTAN